MSNHWSELALCKTIKGIDFFSEETNAIKRAKNLCSKCIVAADCFKQSISADEIYGVWGGLSQRERRKYHREFNSNIEITEAKEIVMKYGNKVIS